MKKHFEPLLLVVLVVASLPALQASRRSFQNIAPTPWGTGAAPGSLPAPASIPSPQYPPPLYAPPPPPTGGGSGAVVPEDRGGGSSGLSGGQKAGILIGVVAGAGLIGFVTMVYMKRRSNIQRARFGVLARRSQL